MQTKKPVADQLRALLINSKWRVGERIPSEHVLATTFGVGRNAIREAIAQLVAERFVEIRSGYGTFVLDWLSNGNLEVFSIVLDVKRGTPRGGELLQQLLGLRRNLYQQLVAPLISGQPSLVELREAVRNIQYGNHGTYYWNDLPALLTSEESVLTRAAFEAGNLPALLLACTIARILLRLPPVDDPVELADAVDRFKELPKAIANKDSVALAALLDELCRLREPLYLDLMKLRDATPPDPPAP